jgi:integrase
MILKWRDRMGERPGTANRTLPVLSVMMTTAETMGLRPHRSNPCRNVTRFPTKIIERFLSLDELTSLGAVLASVEDDHLQDCAIIRLLLLTGARRQEIESLCWSYIDGSFAHLPESKTGPKTLYLGRAARDLLRLLPRSEHDWVFPDEHGTSHAQLAWPRWKRIREAAGVEDVRLHDLRHTFASHAAMNRVTLPTISKLLGHSLLETTERYAHLGDTSVREAVGRVSGHIARASGFAFGGDAR